MAEIQLSDGIECVRHTPFRRALKPLHRELAVGRGAQAVAIHHPELELGLGLALLGGAREPAQRGGIVARNTFRP